MVERHRKDGGKVASRTDLASALTAIATMHHWGIKLFHMVAFCTYAYCIYYSEVHLDIPQRNPTHKRFGRYKYLTHWNLTLQGLMFTMCCFIDFAPLRHKLWLKRLHDHLFLSLSLPVCLFVTGLFWSLYFYDRDLIFPKSMAIYYPNWLNHLSHTTITLFAVLEAKLCYHTPPQRKDGFRTVFIACCAYLGWLVYLGMVYGIWPYPVLEVLSPGLLPVFLGTCASAMFIVYVIAEKINYCFWPVARPGQQTPTTMSETEHLD